MDINTFLAHIQAYQNRVAIYDGINTCTYTDFRNQILHKATAYKNTDISSYLFVANNTIDTASTFFAMISAGKSVFMVSGEDKENWAAHNLPGIYIGSEADQYGAYAVDGGIPAGKVFLLTSGTAKAKRAVQLNFSQLTENAVNALTLYPLKKEDTVMSILPLNHVFGLVSLLASLISGARTGIGIRAANALLRCSSDPLVLHSVPRVLSELLPIISTKSKIHQVLSAGAALSPAIAEQFQQRDINVFEAYGMTETAGAVAIGPFSKMSILPNMDAIIFHDEIYVGGSLMEGYWRESPPDDYLATGDLGEVLPWDILQITGRKKELLVFDNGEKIHPSLLEEIIYQKYADIIECEAYQTSTGQVEAEVYAPLKRMNAPNMLTEINQELPPFARIKKIIIRVSPFPHTETGKLKRRMQNDRENPE